MVRPDRARVRRCNLNLTVANTALRRAVVTVFLGEQSRHHLTPTSFRDPEPRPKRIPRLIVASQVSVAIPITSDDFLHHLQPIQRDTFGVVVQNVPKRPERLGHRCDFASPDFSHRRRIEPADRL
jgi:hypothetical protein